MRLRVWIAIALAGCGASRAGTSPDGGIGTDANGSPDAPPGCTTTVSFMPDHPVAGAGSVVTATGTVLNQQTSATFTWIVKFGGVQLATTQLDQEGEVVTFPVTEAGPYSVHFAAGDAIDCQAYDTTLQVNAPGANTQAWRMRVTPAPGAGAPPQEQLVNVIGGAPEDYGAIALAPGFDIASTVVDGGGAPVAAYLRFTPAAAPDTFVEAFSSAAGAWEARVPGSPQDVLIVPASPSLAPARIASWSPLAPALTVPAADTISGTVRAPGGAPLAGARVALAIAGVPTTIATTDAGGAVDVTVVPPASSGLPELAATATSLDVTRSLAITYAPLATIDLAGTPVRSAGAAAPGATITFTGAIAAAGSITAGATSASAAGVIAATAVAGGGGLLAAAPVPRAPMSAVVAIGSALAVVALDTTGGAPASIDAPAPAAITGTITDPSGAPRANAHVRLTPIGALAAATLVAPAATTGADGRFSIPAAPGGDYALAATDLAQQYAETDAADVTAGDTGALALGAAIPFTAQLEVTGSSQPVVGAAVTFLCATCTGAARAQPVAEAVSSVGGAFTLAVPDPGTSLR